MQCFFTTHVRRYHEHHGGVGHVWQGRFKDGPIQHDDHRLTVLHYIDCYALRGGLARKAEM